MPSLSRLEQTTTNIQQLAVPESTKAFQLSQLVTKDDWDRIIERQSEKIGLGNVVIQARCDLISQATGYRMMTPQFSIHEVINFLAVQKSSGQDNFTLINSLQAVYSVRQVYGEVIDDYRSMLSSEYRSKATDRINSFSKQRHDFMSHDFIKLLAWASVAFPLLHQRIWKDITQEQISHFLQQNTAFFTLADDAYLSQLAALKIIVPDQVVSDTRIQRMIREQLDRYRGYTDTRFFIDNAFNAAIIMAEDVDITPAGLKLYYADTRSQPLVESSPPERRSF